MTVTIYKNFDGADDALKYFQRAVATQTDVRAVFAADTGVLILLLADETDVTYKEGQWDTFEVCASVPVLTERGT